MDWSAPHSGFVLASYALSFVVLGGLIAFTVRRDRKLKRDVAKLEHKRHDP